jgi:phospholipid/cholesterol/gamma-HCH transport system substrate-binding protein
MKFRVRFAEQIVGLFIIIALASLTFVIVMMGRSQRWFNRDPHFFTEFDSAAGLSRNMPVLYKGFTIGNVINFGLQGKDMVEVEFSIQKDFWDNDLVMEGSIVELVINPIGLGNQFHFYPGKGDVRLESGAFIHRIGSDIAQGYIRRNLVDISSNEDSIPVLFSRVNSLIDHLQEAFGAGSDTTEIGQIVKSINSFTAELNEALGAGSDTTEIGQIVGNINRAVSDMEPLQDTIDGLVAMLGATLAAVNPVIETIGVLAAKANDPAGTVGALLEPNSVIYEDLVRSLNSLAGTLEELENIATFATRQLPQISGLIFDIRSAILPAKEVLEALTNNPLLKNGIQDRVEFQSAGTNPRDNIQF